MKKRTLHNLKAPERIMEMGNGEMWRFRMDNNAVYELEQFTGRPFNEVIADLAPVPDPSWVPDPANPKDEPRMLMPRLPVGRMYELAWPMSISHREDEGLLEAYPPAEMDQAKSGFRRFLRILPPPSQMQSLIPFVMEVLAAGLRPDADDAQGNALEPTPGA